MEHMYAVLCERIWQKCQRDSWYGGRQVERYAELDHPQRWGFAYPPANEEQLRTTEAALGFPLPPVLRALYAKVANGGFGPGGGIQGALGGYGSSSYDMLATTIVDDYDRCRQVGYTDMGHRGPVQLIDMANYEGQWKRGSGKEDLLLFPHEVWPEQLLSLEDLGCCPLNGLVCLLSGLVCCLLLLLRLHGCFLAHDWCASAWFWVQVTHVAGWWAKARLPQAWPPG